MKSVLKYLSQKSADYLRDNIRENIPRYKNGNFSDLADKPGKCISLSIEVDTSPLENLILEKSIEAEIENTKIVWNVLNILKPSLACENRLWSRLTHIECLNYSRTRWLDINSSDDDAFVNSVDVHFFANTQTKYRDDNAISRLWWNAYIAKLAMPDNHELAIKTILKSADIRSNFIERSQIVSRPVLASAILRIMISDPWLMAKESNFRDFMKILNHHGGGKVFELWSQYHMDEFIQSCVTRAKAAVSD